VADEIACKSDKGHEPQAQCEVGHPLRKHHEKPKLDQSRYFECARRIHTHGKDQTPVRGAVLEATHSNALATPSIPATLQSRATIPVAITKVNASGESLSVTGDVWV
jgi:hypothetical protein